MKPRSCFAVISMALTCLLLAGCDDSNVPLSNPDNSKPDVRLSGVWRLRDPDGNVTYYHIGLAGDKMPNSVLLVVGVTHSKDGGVEPHGSLLLAFSTKLGDSTYLNMTEGKEQQIKLFEQKDWKSIGSFFLLKYTFDKDVLLIRAMNRDAKQRAIEDRKIKGVIQKAKFNTAVRFTDTTENLARFVAGAGDSLFSKDVLRLERVK